MAKRRIDGVLLFDKPPGLSSNQALQKARWLYQAAKAGHTGTLDPFASGLLPLCFGEATKFSQTLLDADKVYWAELKLGVRTTTADPEGEVIETRPVGFDPDDLDPVLARFVGEFEQCPPMHSAIKKDGRPLYEYARQGIEVERAARRVRVDAIERLSWTGDRLVLRIRCGKGLYVRTLAEDIGAALGCGAHLSALRREAVGPFRIEDALGLDVLGALSEAERMARLLPVDALLGRLRPLNVGIEAEWQLLHGQPIWQPRLQVGEWMRAYGPGGRFIGLVEIDGEGRAAPRRLLASTFG